MIVVGVTGRIGSGKTALCRMLVARYGCLLIDADELGHEALKQKSIRDEVAHRFGHAILVETGEIDRKRLGAVVFSDPEGLRDLDSLVHPWIVESIESRLAQLRSRGDIGIVLVDAAVLLSWKERLPLDRIVWVRAADDVAIERLRLRGMSAEDIARRQGSQPSDEEFRKGADLILSNDGNLDDLVRESERLMEALRGV